LVLLQDDPSAAVRAAAVWLLGPSGGPGAGLAVALLALTLAGWAAPRVTAGLDGWARHLPASEASHRRTALVAIGAAQAPLVVGLLLLAPAAAAQPGGLAPLRLVALPLIVGAAAAAAWPGERSWASRPLALLALLLLAQPSAPRFVAACLAVILADRLSGPLARAAGPRRSGAPRSLPTHARIALRALGPSALWAVVVALLPLAAMAFLRANNDLEPAVAAGAARLGGALGVVVLLTRLAERLAIRRPPWPWARSLPVGARTRTGEDASSLACVALVPVVATAALDPVAAATVATCLPYLSLRAAAALRPRRRARAGADPFFLVEGALLAGGIALLPWLALGSVALAPLAWRAAAERDRRLQVSRWDERQHQAVGDPLSWSPR
jgi:hypothetical protein